MEPDLMPTGKNLLLGLLGYPLGHSVSPVLHRVAGESFGMNVNYFPFETRREDLGDALRGMRVLRFTGCNVTIPHKEEIVKFADHKSETVEFLGAANTLIFRGNSVFAENTDWMGFIESWKEEGMSGLAGKRAAVLGAGGAADAVFYALAMEGAGEIRVFNRTRERAGEMVEKFRERFPGLEAAAYSINNPGKINETFREFDVLVNTTPVGMSPAVDKTPVKIPDKINPGLEYYDLIYNPMKTLMVNELEARGIKAAGGLGMLVHQAALAFERWFGLRPDTKAMMEAGKRALQSN